jgi:hypothetical protein
MGIRLVTASEKVQHLKREGDRVAKKGITRHITFENVAEEEFMQRRITDR